MRLMMCMVTAVFAYALDSFWTDAQQHWCAWDRSKQASFACIVTSFTIPEYSLLLVSKHCTAWKQYKT